MNPRGAAQRKGRVLIVWAAKVCIARRWEATAPCAKEVEEFAAFLVVAIEARFDGQRDALDFSFVCCFLGCCRLFCFEFFFFGDESAWAIPHF